MRADFAASWQRCKRYSGLLTLAWLLANLGGLLALPWCADWQWLGYPLPFWLAAQGLPLFYLLLNALCRRLLAPLAPLTSRITPVLSEHGTDGEQ